MTAPVPTVTSLEILPAYGQSENRPIRDALAEGIEAAASGQAVQTFGMRDGSGALVGMAGAGLAEIDRTRPATGFLSVTGQGLVSPAFVFQFLRAARWRAQGEPLRGAILGDNGYGGRLIREWIPDDPSPIGRNQLYWMEESARLAGVFGIAISCPHVLLFQGTSAKDQPGAEYRSQFETAHAALLARAATLFGTVPQLVVVVNGADVNSADDRYDTPGVQYRIALDHGGIVATWQRAFAIRDQNIHPDARTQVLIGETCAWAAEEVEAGNPWNITFAVSRSGAEVTVSFALRPGETLVERAGLYDAFGGPATCPHFGFEAEGGIAQSVLEPEAGRVRLTLADPAAGWLRLAHQMQDCGAMTDAAGMTMSAHRSTLFGSHTRPSALIAGETLWRPVPGFRGRLEGDLFVPE